MVDYYVKGGSNYDTGVEANIWIAVHRAGYPEADFEDVDWKDFNTSGASKDPYLRLGGDGGESKAEFGLSGNFRIRCIDSDIQGYHAGSGIWATLFGSGVASAGASQLDELTDVNNVGYTSGYVLKADGSIFDSSKLTHVDLDSIGVTDHHDPSGYESISGDYLTHSGNEANPHHVLLNEVEDPDGETHFSFGTSHVHFTFTAPQKTSHDGAFEIEGGGNFSGHLVHIHQHTGSPLVEYPLLYLECEANNIRGIEINMPNSQDTGLRLLTGGICMMNQGRICMLIDPVNPQDAVTKAYSDIISGLYATHSIATDPHNVVSGNVYSSDWDGVTDVAPDQNSVYDIIESIKVTERIGAANRGYIQGIYEGCDIDGYAVVTQEIKTVLARAGYLLWGLPLDLEKTVLGTTYYLHIDRIRIGQSDADANDYISQTLLGVYNSALAVTWLVNDTTNLTTVGEIDVDFTAVSCEGYRRAFLDLYCSTANPSDWGNVYMLVRYYYDT